MTDNIGNPINIGDYVLCLSGNFKYTIQIVRDFRVILEDFGNRTAVSFDGHYWLSTYNVISLTAMGIDNFEKTHDPRCDLLGHHLNVGDKVLFHNPMEFYAEIGIIKKLSEKSCLLDISKNRFNQTQYRKKYSEIISLTALNLNDLTIRHTHG